MTGKIHTGCEHPPVYHEEGLCWKVTSPELENEDTNDKYCPCSINKGTIRRYDRVGYMEIQPHDKMITKKCSLCSAEGLFTLTNSICSACKVLSHYNPD